MYNKHIKHISGSSSAKMKQQVYHTSSHTLANFITLSNLKHDETMSHRV